MFSSKISKVIFSVFIILIFQSPFLFGADESTGLSFGIWDAVQIFGSLTFFIYGMKLMSDGIQRAAGSQMRNVLRTMTKNRYLGVFTGFLITALVQSSSATTVMTVSFVNAGLLSLLESAGVMMGANIGTTITGWVVSLLGFKLKLSAYSIPLFAVGVPMLFAGKGKIKHWGEFIIGFAILFMGLSFLKGAVPDLKQNPEVLNFLQQFTQWGFFSRLFFVFVGTIVTIVVQSSSAAMAITLTLCSQGILPFEVAAAMILGENIGTTITAELASLVGNTNAKRSARIHSMFNIIGVTWMVILMPFILPALSNFAQSSFGMANPYTSADSMPIALSAFHTFFNITNVLLLLAFVPWLVKMAVKTVPEKESEDSMERLKFINTTNRTPELATVELQKEVARYGEITTRMLGFSKELINSIDEKNSLALIAKLRKYEDITDKFEEEITKYITDLSDQKMTHKTSLRLRSFFNICNDMERVRVLQGSPSKPTRQLIQRIGDIFYQLAKTVEGKMKRKIYFTPEQRNQLNDLIEIVSKAFDEMNRNLNLVSYDEATIGKCYDLEDEINVQRNTMRKFNRENLNNENYNVDAAMVFTNLFSSLERVGDHIVNVNESVAGEI
jgi:phosphate:Na+ symporter